MGWWSDLFKTKPSYGPATTFSCNVPMPEVKPTKPEKDISEPVLAIVEAMKTRPSTFKLSVFENVNDHTGCFYNYSITDIKTSQVLNVCKGCGYSKPIYIFSWGWLTEDEEELMVTTFTELLKHKVSRTKSLQRAKMKGIYK